MLPKGDKGDTGSTGAQGPEGPQGPTGPSGADGKDGKDGADGKDGTNGQDGQDGQDGFSPIVQTSKSGKTTTITITDANGDHTSTILDGEDGASQWGDISGTLSNQTDLQGALDGKQATLVSGTNIKTINNISLLGSGNINVGGGGTATDVQINGTSIVFNNSANIVTKGTYNASSNKIATESDVPDVSSFITKDANDLTYYYTKTEVDGKVSSVYKYKGTVSTYANLPSSGQVTGDVYNVEQADSTHGIKAGDNVAWNGTIWDVLGGEIDLSGYQAKIDSSHKLSSDLVDDTNNTNKFVTASDKTAWNAKYDKPSGGIPSTDLSSAVQTSLGKADTALQSETYTGTITSVKMNGSTIATSGEADLGTVITSHQDISGKVDVEVNMTDANNRDYTGKIENNGKTIKLQADTDYTNIETYLECKDASIDLLSTHGNYAGGISANATEPQMISQYSHDNTMDAALIFNSYLGPNISYYKNGTLKGAVEIDSTGTSITGVVTPTTNDMAANKDYVDTGLSGKQAKFWEGTKAQYDAITTKDPDTYYAITDDADMTAYQPVLVSGTNIKTINNESILGSGNITIQGGGSSTDVQINGTSIVSSGTANILTNTAYNASSNKIATMADIANAITTALNTPV